MFVNTLLIPRSKWILISIEFSYLPYVDCPLSDNARASYRFIFCWKWPSANYSERPPERVQQCTGFIGWHISCAAVIYWLSRRPDTCYGDERSVQTPRHSPRGTLRSSSAAFTRLLSSFHCSNIDNHFASRWSLSRRCKIQKISVEIEFRNESRQFDPSILLLHLV